MKKRFLKKISLLLIVLAPMQTLAEDQKSVVIGVIDTGIDFSHPSLKDKTGLASGLGTAEKFPGWDFVTNKAASFPAFNEKLARPEVLKYGEAFFRVRNQTASASEQALVKKGDASNVGADFRELLMIAHGTAVGDVAARGQKAKVISLRFMDSKTDPKFRTAQALSEEQSQEKLKEAQEFGATYLKEQKRIFADLTKYLQSNNILITNNSWAFDAPRFPSYISELFFMQSKIKLADTTARMWALDVLNELKPILKEFIQKNRKTLFVMGSGNGGLDNDETEIYPQSFQLDNLLVVGASDGYTKPAVFSSYGAKTVHVMAPGTEIECAFPGNNWFVGSATSLATAVLTNMIAEVLENNTMLKPKELKALVIQTADERAFAKGKVVSNGTAHPERLLEAAKLMKDTTLKVAVAKSFDRISKPKEGHWEKAKKP